MKGILVLFLYASGLNALVGLFMNKKAYLIGYHSIAEDNSPEFSLYKKVTISSKVFEEHLKYLKKKGHTFVLFSKIREALDSGVKKPTAIFFDDGFRNNLTVAMPIMKRYAAPMTVFVTTGYLNGTHNPPQNETDTPNRDHILSWEDAGTIKKEGGEIGSHGLSHQKLTDISVADLRKELTDSREEIARRLGEPPRSLSYPRGRYNLSVVRETKKTGYLQAVSTVEGVNSADYLKDHSLELRRIAPKPYDSTAMFKVKVYSWNLIKAFERLWS